jgi:hydrogenase maturation protein HypF
MHRRHAISVSGIVQGVGFRPHVYNLARRHGLAGLVKNDSGTVWIEVEGEDAILDQFLTELTTNPPPLARIAAVRCTSLTPCGEQLFRIVPSGNGETSPIFIGPDIATCDDCLRELFDPADRRYRYPFLNCTNCGPRLTIIRGVPYDRERTTMAGFGLCPACRAEYDDPADRRFHAQPTACARCGPRLQLLDRHGHPVAPADPLADAVAALRRGEVGAIKGLGGYHLACAADQEQAVAEVRRRKHRDDKPFALMVADLPAAEALCEIATPEKALLRSPARPIVLLRRRPEAVVAPQVAPGNPHLGVMLPYSPLHHLLLHDLVGVPLVLTSGNQSDEPIAYEDADALQRLAGIADFFLTHDRPIHLRCDDSVTRVVAGAELPVRRSRGYTPQPLPLPLECPRPILALGGQLKNSFALGRGRHAFLSHYLGDLDHYPAYRAYTEAVAHYERLFAVRPEVLVCDLHPDYGSTRYAQERARDGGQRLLAVQHHHAHLAACLVEHGLQEPAIGVTFDGTGYGTDGTIWGGEFLVGAYHKFERRGRLRQVGMPGGDQAIREPWRMALAYLLDAGADPAVLAADVSSLTRATVTRMIPKQFQTPLTSSAGRLFDGVAALAGVRGRVSYEGQAAVELEWLSCRVPPDGVYPFGLEETVEGEPPVRTVVVDVRPLIREMAAEVRRGTAPAIIGRRFHSTGVEVIAAVCGRIREWTGLEAVVLSGGVFLNALLTAEVTERLTRDGFRAYRHRRVPPNDGGLCLGQLAIAAAWGSREERSESHVPGNTGKSRGNLPGARRPDGQG